MVSEFSKSLKLANHGLDYKAEIQTSGRWFSALTRVIPAFAARRQRDRLSFPWLFISPYSTQIQELLALSYKTKGLSNMNGICFCLSGSPSEQSGNGRGWSGCTKVSLYSGRLVQKHAGREPKSTCRETLSGRPSCLIPCPFLIALDRHRRRCPSTQQSIKVTVINNKMQTGDKKWVLMA